MDAKDTTIPCPKELPEVQAVYEKPPRYRSHLLTLWEERGRDASTPGVWRFRLEDPHTGERVGFGSIDELFDYLRQQTETAPVTAGGRERGPERR
jgi:hypothetical protein